ncbi:MAG: deoxyribose-phosphate aldolase [Pikeienuella sp.]
MSVNLESMAKKVLSCLDLTNLNDDCTSEAVEALCQRAMSAAGHTAAVCVWPDFVAEAVQHLANSGVKVATVVNFPSGEEPAGAVMEMTENAVAMGADEIDLVVPYQSFLEGQEEKVFARVRRVKSAAGSDVLVKAILETGMLNDPEKIRRVAELAIDGGADFIKTSTGKVPVNATLSAARTLLEVIKQAERPIGFKPAGGVKTVEQGAHFIELADEIMGEGWVSPNTFRIGASGVWDDVMAVLSGAERDTPGDNY